MSTFSVVEHNGIACLCVEIDAARIGITACAYIAIDAVEASIVNYKEMIAMGGKPSKGTKADKRLKENKPRMPVKQMKNMPMKGKS